jgi:hypothetical protein
MSMASSATYSPELEGVLTNFLMLFANQIPYFTLKISHISPIGSL